jgi:short-subunit dehydrogenase
VDALALNAGVGVGGAFTDSDLAAELRIVALNCGSTVHLAKRVVPTMVGRGQGRVLLTSSIASLAPQPFQAVYGASKAFVQSFALALREELRDTGVTVTALLPGPTDTEFFEGPGFAGTRLGETSAKDDPAQVARQGFEGLMDGEEQVRAGSLASRAMGRLSELTPDSLAVRVQRKATEPGGAD